MNKFQPFDCCNTESAVGTFVYMLIGFQTPFQVEAEWMVLCRETIEGDIRFIALRVRRQVGSRMMLNNAYIL